MNQTPPSPPPRTARVVRAGILPVAATAPATQPSTIHAVLPQLLP